MANGYYERRGSLFGPLVLIAIGVLFLLRNRIPGFDFYELFSRYWPVLLILWGLVRLVEHYSYAPGAQRRIGLGPGEVLLLIVIVLVGLAFTASLHLRDSDWGRQMGMEFWDPFERSFPFTAHAEAALPAGVAVVVRGFRGGVELTPGGAGIVLVANDAVHANSEDTANALFARSQPIIRSEDGQIVVLPAGADPDARVEANIQLTLPAATPVTVQTDNGDLRVGHWRAPLDLSTGRGDITASDNAGDMHLHAAHGDVMLQGLSGGLQLDGGGGDVTLDDISGHVAINGDYTGDLSFSRLPRGLEFSSSRTQMTLAALPGSLDLDMGDLHARAVSGLQVETQDKDVEIQQFQGALRVSDSDGSIAVIAAAAPAQPVDLGDRDGDVSLRVPATSAFTFSASARQGSIVSDFPLVRSGNEQMAQASATIGAGGPIITLRTSNGTVALRKASGIASQ